MTDYIERAAAINAVLGITICNPMVRQYADAVLFNLNKLPAADVRPVRTGKWIEEETVCFAEDFHGYSCSVCGHYVEILCATVAQAGYNYCPNCGAELVTGCNQLEEDDE